MKLSTLNRDDLDAELITMVAYQHLLKHKNEDIEIGKKSLLFAEAYSQIEGNLNSMENDLEDDILVKKLIEDLQQSLKDNEEYFHNSNPKYRAWIGIPNLNILGINKIVETAMILFEEYPNDKVLASNLQRFYLYWLISNHILFDRSGHHHISENLTKYKEVYDRAHEVLK